PGAGVRRRWHAGASRRDRGRQCERGHAGYFSAVFARSFHERHSEPGQLREWRVKSGQARQYCADFRDGAFERWIRASYGKAWRADDSHAYLFRTGSGAFWRMASESSIAPGVEGSHDDTGVVRSDAGKRAGVQPWRTACDRPIKLPHRSPVWRTGRLARIKFTLTSQLAVSRWVYPKCEVM